MVYLLIINRPSILFGEIAFGRGYFQVVSAGNVIFLFKKLMLVFNKKKVERYVI